MTTFFMKNRFNILVFPGGTEIGLEINKSLAQCKNIKLFSAGSPVSSHAPFVYARHFDMPSIHETGWIDELNKLILVNSIDYIFPAYDDIIVALAENSCSIKAKIVSSPLDTCLITRSKLATYRHLASVLPVPTIYPDADAVEQYPVFVKPDKGQGSEDTHLAKTKDQLLQLIKESKKRIIMEYLPGQEFTVDCFSDRDAGILFCSGRERVRTKNGISMSSRITTSQGVFNEFSEIIASRIALHGAWFFQIKKDKAGLYKLLEIAPRIAGTMSLHRVQGINFPLLSIYEQERIPITVLKNNASVEIDRALVNRYKHNIVYHTVYIDLDDTLIINGKVNIQLVGFLYQCVNEGKKIVLITKHDRDVTTTLKNYRLSDISDEVIHIGRSCTKADYIKERDAIFIDDSFSERKSVSDKLGICTFDCSMVEVLLDERR